MKTISALIAATVSLLAAGAAESAPLITNGSFETPTVPSGGFTTFSVGSSAITGYTVVGPANTAVAIVNGTFSQNGVSFPAQDGIQWLDLTGNGSNSTEGVSQSVATIAGDQYQLSYFVGNTTGGGVFGTTSTVNVSVNGAPTFSDTNSIASPTTLTWEPFTHTFVAAGPSTTLSFLNGDPGGDNSNGLENIVLTDLGPVGTPVPEPASLALFASALAGFGLIRRRRSRA